MADPRFESQPEAGEEPVYEEANTKWAGNTAGTLPERPASPQKKLSIAAYYGDHCASASESS